MGANSPHFIRRLFQREVVQTLVLYTVVGFVVVEGLGFLAQSIGLIQADSINRYLRLTYLLGFPVAIFLAWYYDLNRKGLHHEKGGQASFVAVLVFSLCVLLGGGSMLFHMLN